MAEMEPESVDAVVTDPPYGLEFMGKGWDRGVPGIEFWKAAFRVLKPGGHLLAFGGSRTYHCMACAVEDAGFEIRDQIQWLYGSGFPKSLDVSKAFDKAAGAEREVVGRRTDRAATPSQNIRGGRLIGGQNGKYDGSAITAPSTELAQRWNGWGTVLKPAHEPIVVARKPLIGTVAANVERYNTGALNIDGCRIPSNGDHKRGHVGPAPGRNVYGDRPRLREGFTPTDHDGGRWPANVVLDEEAGRMLDKQSGRLHAGGTSRSGNGSIFGNCEGEDSSKQRATFNDPGGASRFFYCAKASRKERGEGNGHPTVKPIALMRWLVRLVTPPGGLVLDPFAGSGTTGIACVLESFQFMGIEQNHEYAQIAEKRIAAVEPSLFTAAR